MFNDLFKFLSSTQKGFLYLILGLVLILGALSKLGFLQNFLNIILITVGILLIYQGIIKTNIFKKLK